MALYIVPVPIGNLKDITLRAIEVLSKVDFIIAEDTRYSLKLLNHLKIKKRMISYYKPKEAAKADLIVKLLEKQEAAIITDSGTPAVSDPGNILIKKAVSRGIQIIPLPGPTAFVPALVASGLKTEKFIFLGFSPRKKGELKKYLKKLAGAEYTMIFYESPRRTLSFLRAAFEIWGNRRFSLAKELSKKNEKIIRGELEDLEETLKDEIILGEIVIVIEGEGRKKSPAVLKIQTMEDIYDIFLQKFNISKNTVKNVIMKRKKD